MKQSILAILLLPLLISCNTAHAQTYTVERVIDGDTLKLSNGEEVQLIGVEIPKDEKMGQEATELVKGLIKPGQEVRLEFDVQEKDKYGRLLAYVYKLICLGACKYDAFYTHHIVRLDDGVYNFINATIIKAGYATPMTIPPNVKYADLFKGLYEEAREQKRGLWAEESDLLLLDFNSKPEKIAIPMH